MTLVPFLIKKQSKENEVIGKDFFLQSLFYKVANIATEKKIKIYCLKT